MNKIDTVNQEIEATEQTMTDTHENLEIQLLKKQLSTLRILTVFIMTGFGILLAAGIFLALQLRSTYTQLEETITACQNAMVSIDTTMSDAQTTFTNVNTAVEEARTAISSMETAATDLDALVVASNEIVSNLNEIDFESLNTAITNLTNAVNGFSAFTSLFNRN